MLTDETLAHRIQDMPRNQIAARIKQARSDAKKTLDGLGDEVGTSRHHLIRLENGTHRPRPAMLEAIAEATGKPLDFFLAAEVQDGTARFPGSV